MAELFVYVIEAFCYIKLGETEEKEILGIYSTKEKAIEQIKNAIKLMNKNFIKKPDVFDNVIEYTCNEIYNEYTVRIIPRKLNETIKASVYK